MYLHFQPIYGTPTTANSISIDSFFSALSGTRRAETTVIFPAASLSMFISVDQRPPAPRPPASATASPDDPFQGWDPLSSFDVSDGDFDAAPDDDLFSISPTTFSSGLKLISPGLAQPATSHVAQLPVRESTWTRFESRVIQPRFCIVGAMSGTIDSEFEAACQDPTLRFNPRALGFIPVPIWQDEEVLFGHCVTEFFQKKNNANCRFSHKLFNAIKLSEFRPEFPRLTGVMWLNDTILRVDKVTFARLLGIKSIDGSLFHQRGNFPSHGFFEIGWGDQERFVPPDLDMTDVDFENVRILVHPMGLFRRGCTSDDIEKCRWANWRLYSGK
jgi:hypothetical protein